MGKKKIEMEAKSKTYEKYQEYLRKAKKYYIEGAVIDGLRYECMAEAYFEGADGIVINPAAYTHTSVAILDALGAVAIPTVEVHLSDINQREEFRRHSFVSMIAKTTVCGLGFEGYKVALEYFCKQKD